VPDLLAWMEGSGVATTIRGSLTLTASLSAFHVLGVTLVGGGAFVSGLRWGGLLFSEYPIAEIVRPAGRAIVIGLSISVATGLLLFATRASMAVENGYFQLKMSLLFGATVCQILVYRRVTPVGAFAGSTRFIGMLGAAMYLGVVAAGSAFILLE
jgi:hypothetical protein